MTRPPVASVQRPSLALLGADTFRAAIESARQKLGKRRQQRPGDGHPVVIFPGLGAHGSSVTTLVDHCRSLGYEAVAWGRGFNTGPRGDPDAWLANLKSQVSAMLAHHAKPATLIGWSLGGLYARELGKQMASRIRQVITIGTPFNADADLTHAGWLFRLHSGSSAEIAPMTSRTRCLSSRTKDRCPPSFRKIRNSNASSCPRLDRAQSIPSSDPKSAVGALSRTTAKDLRTRHGRRVRAGTAGDAPAAHSNSKGTR